LKIVQVYEKFNEPQQTEQHSDLKK